MSDQAEKLRQKMMVRRDPLKSSGYISIIEVQPGAHGAFFSYNLAKSFVSRGCHPYLLDIENKKSKEDQLSRLLNLKTQAINVDKQVGDLTFSETDFVLREGVSVYLTSFEERGSGFQTLIKQVGAFVLNQAEERHHPLFITQTAEREPILDEVEKASFILLVTKGEPHDLVEAYTLIKRIHYVDQTLPIGIVITCASTIKGAKEAFDTLSSVSTRFLERTLFLGGFLANGNKLERTLGQAEERGIFDQCTDLILKRWNAS